MATPNIDPRLDTRNPIRYLPSVPLAAVAFTLYLIVGLILLWHYLRLKVKRGSSFTLILTIGIFFFCLGIILRIPFASYSNNISLYIPLSLFTVLSPCAFLAFNYILLGRIALSLDTTRYLLIPQRLLARLFVGADISTFIIQAGGSGLLVAGPSLMSIGSKIYLAGIVLQLISYAAFTCICLIFAYRLRKNEPALWANAPNHRWKALFYVLLFSNIGVLIRSAFRSAEFAQGFDGYLATHEVFIYCLDILPLFTAVVLYTYWFPTFCLSPPAKNAGQERIDSLGMVENGSMKA